VLSVNNEHVRVWDVETLLAEGNPNLERPGSDNIARVNQLAVMAGEEPQLYVGGFDEVAALDPVTGAIRWRRTFSSSRQTTVALAASNRHGVVAASGSTLHLLDPLTGVLTRSIDTGLNEIIQLRLSELKGRPVVVLNAEERHAWATWVWDLDKGREIGTDHTFGHKFGLSHGQEDKPLYGLAVLRRGEQIRFAFASKYSMVMVANFPDAVEDVLHRPFLEWHFSEQAGQYVRALPVGKCDDRTLLVAGTDHGAIIVWDFDSGICEGCRLNAHIGSTDHVCFGMIAGDSVLIAGGTDAMVSLWTPSLEPLSQIEIGERITSLAWMPPDGLAVGGMSGVLVLRFQ